MANEIGVPSISYHPNSRPAYFGTANPEGMVEPAIRRGQHYRADTAPWDQDLPYEQVCEGRTKSGDLCKAYPVSGGRFCVFHEKSLGEEVDESAPVGHQGVD